MQPHVSERFNPLYIACKKLAEGLGAQPYFVGGALYKHERPRDIDIRFILQDEAFVRRFGLNAAFFSTIDPYMIDRPTAWWEWKEECRRLGAIIAESIGDRNIDFVIYPQSVWDRYCKKYEDDPVCDLLKVY